jgi:hypothetical protein
MWRAWQNDTKSSAATSSVGIFERSQRDIPFLASCHNGGISAETAQRDLVWGLTFPQTVHQGLLRSSERDQSLAPVPGMFKVAA